jgi:hypothetical protein
LANGEAAGAGGTKEVIIMLAVDVGERCKVRGCVLSVWPDPALLYNGFGRARICERRLSSRKVACNSMT